METLEEEDLKFIPSPPRKNSDSGKKYPLLFVDINTGLGAVERVIIYEGDTGESVA